MGGATVLLFSLDCGRTSFIDVAERIERLVADVRSHIARSVNIAEVITKYEIGRIIVEVVQEGRDKDAVMRLTQEGQTISKPDDILRVFCRQS